MCDRGTEALPTTSYRCTDPECPVRLGSCGIGDLNHTGACLRVPPDEHVVAVTGIERMPSSDGAAQR